MRSYLKEVVSSSVNKFMQLLCYTMTGIIVTIYLILPFFNLSIKLSNEIWYIWSTLTIIWIINSDILVNWYVKLRYYTNPSPIEFNDVIFISYKRNDCANFTGRLYDRLRFEFGSNAIFRDIDSIPYGVDFTNYIDRSISRCKVVLIIICKNWQIKNRSPKYTDETDYIRMEIETAFKYDKHIIPILSDSKMPSKNDLPKSLTALTKLNGVVIRSEPNFNKDIILLIQRLKEVLLN